MMGLRRSIRLSTAVREIVVSSPSCNIRTVTRSAVSLIGFPSSSSKQVSLSYIDPGRILYWVVLGRGQRVQSNLVLVEKLFQIS